MIVDKGELWLMVMSIAGAVFVFGFRFLEVRRKKGDDVP